MPTFAVTSTDDLIDAVNYAIANLGNVGNIANIGNAVTGNSTTGQIKYGNNVIAYLYQYIWIAYADSADGNTGFTTSSQTNKGYYGVRNTNNGTTQSTNPADYVWNQVTGGFGITKAVYYQTLGGRSIQFRATATNPGTGWNQYTNGTAIDLDVVTSTTTNQIITQQIYYRATSVPATPTGGTYDFSSLILTPPSGWSASVPAGTTPIWVSTNTFESSPLTPTVGPSGAWTTPTLYGELGTSTFTVVAYADSTSIPATPSGGYWDFSSGTGIAPTGNVTWALTPSTPTGNLYTSQSVASGTGAANVALSNWSTPVEFGAAPGTDGLSVFYYSTFQAAATQPATPGTSGSFNFGTLVGTPPTGWSNNPPTPSPGQVIWVTSAKAAVSTPSGIWTATSGDWSTPVQYNGTAGTDALILATVYSNGSIFSKNNANVWSPVPAANVISTTANTIATQGTTVKAYQNKIISYNIGTQAWSETNGTSLNPSYFAYGSIASDTQRFNQSIAYNDGTSISSQQLELAVVESGVNGNAGPAGSRGFIPLAYIITPSDPNSANNATLSTGFSALRTNGSPPVGISPDAFNIYTPIPGDTAQFIYTTTGANRIATYNGTAWTNVTGAVIDGNLLVTGTVTSNKLNVNDLYAINIQSTNATPFSPSSNGYWLQASTGDARFAGNVSIGSNLTVGTIISNSDYNPNSVGTTALAPYAVTTGKIANLAVGSNQLGTSSVIAGKIATNAVQAGAIQAGAVTANEIAANTITGDKIAAATITGSKIAAQTITASNILSNTITASQIAANTITATQISTSYIYAGNIVSTNGNLGNVNSTGYWLQYNTGDARFGGNVYIGNNLTVGNLITASALNANTVTATNIVPGVIPNAGSTIFNPGSVSMTSSAGTWDGVYSGSVYYKYLAWQKINASPIWIGGTGPTIKVIASCYINATGYTVGGGYPQVFLYVNCPAYGGNQLFPAISGGSIAGSYNIRTDSTVFSQYGAPYNGTYGYASGSLTFNGPNFWTASYPTVFGFVIMNPLNGTWNISQIQFNINYQ